MYQLVPRARRAIERRSVLADAASLLGLATAGQLLVMGLGWAGSQIDNAVTRWLESERSIQRDIDELERQLEERRARLEEIIGQREVLEQARDEVAALPDDTTDAH